MSNPLDVPTYTPSPPRLRQALGLPAGSVRALLALMVFGTIWALLLMPADKEVYVPQYLYYLAFLIIGSYFTSRGQPGEDKGPLGLPRGTLRILFALGFVAAISYAYYSDPTLLDRLQLNPDEKPTTMMTPLVLLNAFLLGVLVARLANWLLAGPQGLPPWYQDTLAWVSILAVLGLAFVVIYYLVINPSVPTKSRVELPVALQLTLSGIVAFYFGTRS